MASRSVGFGGFSSTALDINDAGDWGYSRSTGSPFDLLSDSGMVLLVSIYVIVSGFGCCFIIARVEACHPGTCANSRGWLHGPSAALGLRYHEAARSGAGSGRWGTQRKLVSGTAT